MLVPGLWASVSDVTTVTGASVSSETLEQAQAVVDVYSNVTAEASGNLSTRDIRLLGLAHCYQAAWMTNQVDVVTRTDVSDVTQDGLQFKPANPEALLLAPLAKRCLDRLSWRKARSLRVRSGRGSAYQDVEAYEAAWLRDGDGTDQRWEAM